MKDSDRRRIEREILQKKTGMRHCASCNEFRAPDDFPAPGAIRCSRCLVGQSQSRVDPALDFRGLDIKRKGDSFVIEKADDPNAIPMEADELTKRLKESAPMFGTPSDVLGDRGQSHKFGPGYDDIRTQRATRRDDSVAKMLLNATSKKLDDAVKAGYVPEYTTVDDRTLIDKLHEATFGDDVGLQWIEDKYALRIMLRKAHCFTLDAVTSGLVSDFSVAIASDLESARRMAMPPFPITWIDLDNRARLTRMSELGVGLTHNAATDAVYRVGWLIHPDTINGGHYATYCCAPDQGVTLSPLSYWWHTDASQTGKLRPEVAERLDIDYMDRLSFGMKDSGVNPADAIPSPTPMHIERMRSHKYPEQVRELMLEIGGELRHIWGFLIALGAGQLGMEARYSEQAKPETPPPTMKNGKPLLPLEHKVLHLHLAKKMTPARVVVRMMTHHKHRWHEVRAHFRTYKNPDGTVRMRIPIKSHERGDERLGRIEKTYKVEK
jgi:hypothetical protein